MLVEPISYALIEIVKAPITKTKDVSESNDLERIKSEDINQEVSLQMIERQAKVMQEVAIAKRIETADEVEIEEFYDGSGEGNVGLKAGSESLSLGLSGKGNHVVKRVYRFKNLKLEAPEQSSSA